jgi:hypothetical protein
MGFIKKLKKGVKKTGGALKSGAQKTGGVVKTGAKATGKGIAKGAKHVAAIPKNTYKTTKQLGGALKKPVSHLINDSFSDIVVAILKIPAILTVYGLALCVGILLAVFLGTNSSNIWQGINVFPCEWNFSANFNNYACKCTRSSCRIAYPSECSSVISSTDACVQASNPPSNPYMLDSWSDKKVCVQPLSDSNVWVESAGIEGGLANIIFADPRGSLRNISDEYDDIEFYMENTKLNCSVRNPDCLGSALQNSTTNRDISIKIIGVIKDPICNGLNSGKPFNGPLCELFASGFSVEQIKEEYVKYSYTRCPIYSTTIRSSQVTLIAAKPISGNFWAEGKNLIEGNSGSNERTYKINKGDCATLHWSYNGDVAEAIISVSPDNNSNHYSIHDAMKVDSFTTCPVEGVTDIFLITDQNGEEKEYTIYFDINYEPVAEPAKFNRCEVFTGIHMSVVYLDWTAGSPLTFYIKMPGGVPGLEKNIAGDTQPWSYSAAIATATTNNCRFEEYKERLYCTITLPSGYANTIRPLAVSVNGCSSPIFTDSMAAIPGYEAGSETNSCGQSPVYNAPSCSSWCACMGGTLNISCGGGECTIVGSPPCSDYCSIP